MIPFFRSVVERAVFGTLRAEDVPQSVISFVAFVGKHPEAWRLRQLQHHRPRLRVDRGIVDRHLIVERLVVLRGRYARSGEATRYDGLRR